MITRQKNLNDVKEFVKPCSDNEEDWFETKDKDPPQNKGTICLVNQPQL